MYVSCTTFCGEQETAAMASDFEASTGVASCQTWPLWRIRKAIPMRQREERLRG